MEKTPTYLPPKLQEEEEIDLIALVKKLWLGRVKILKAVAICATLGVVIAFSSSKQYTATSTIVPQLGGDSNSKLGSLGGLAALAGINLDMNPQNGSELSPLVYPQIVASIPFQLELMNTPLNYSVSPQPVTLYEYLINIQKPTVIEIVMKYTVGLPGIILKSISGDQELASGNSNNELNPLYLTLNQARVQNLLNDLVTLDVNPKEGFLTLTVNLSEPLATAQLALKAQNLLQKYITEFRTRKSQANLDFIEASYIKAKKDFEQAQVKLAVSTDRSKGFVTGLAQVETDRLQSQYTITFGVYQELAKQFEQAKIQVKKETPVFTVINPPVIPIDRTKPKKSLIVLAWIFLGGIAGCGLVVGKEYWEQLSQKWKEV